MRNKFKIGAEMTTKEQVGAMSDELIETSESDVVFHLKKTAFVRKRWLGGKEMLHILLRGIMGSLHLTLDHYLKQSGRHQ